MAEVKRHVYTAARMAAVLAFVVLLGAASVGAAEEKRAADRTVGRNASIRSGVVTLGATRLPSGALAVRAKVELIVRRPFVAQVIIAPCNAVLNPLSTFPLEPVYTFVGRDLVTRTQVRRGRATLRVQGQVNSNAAGDPYPRNWTDCAVATAVDERSGSPIFRDGARVTLTVTDIGGQHLPPPT